MSRSQNEKAKEARKLYKGGMKLVEIARQLEVPAGTIRRWKSIYDWDNERSDCKTNESERSKAISWVNIEHEYVTDIRKKPCTLEELATKHNIAIGTIEKYSMQHEWSEKRKSYKESIQQKALEKSSDKDADRIARLLQIADMATEKAEQALGELEQYVVRDKKKVRTVEYKDNMAIGKPTKEVIDETEHINIASGPIDRLGLSQVTGALKSLKDIYMIPTTLEKQKAEIALLKSKADAGKDALEGKLDRYFEQIEGVLKDVE